MNPERRYRFDYPVTAVEFSEETPQLMAVGFFNGMIQVLDISDSDTNCIVAKSQRNESAGFEPIWDMKWILGKFIYPKIVLLKTFFCVHSAGTEEELLTVSEDGLVMKYRLTNGPYLHGQRQIKLEMVLGDVEGLVINNIRPVVMDRFGLTLLRILTVIPIISSYLDNHKHFASRHIPSKRTFSSSAQTKVAYINVPPSYRINIREYCEYTRVLYPEWNFLHSVRKYFSHMAVIGTFEFGSKASHNR